MNYKFNEDKSLQEGKNKKDLLKILHYGIMMLDIHNKENQ